MKFRNICSKFVTLGLLCFGSLTGYASAFPQFKLVLCLNTGAEYEYVLSECPTISFEGDDALICCDEVELSRYSRSALSRYYFADAVEETPSGEEFIKISDTIEKPLPPTSIESVVADPTKVTFRYVDNNTVTLEGLAAEENVRLYSVDGLLLSNGNSTSEEIYTIDLSSLPQGIYIIRTNHQSFKIRKK